MIEHESAALGELGVRHGFGGRRGGVSGGAFATANASWHVGDADWAVAENRRRFATALGSQPERLCTLRQVHGTDVVAVDGPPLLGTSGDALVSRMPGLLLAVTTADCVPVLVVDASTGWTAAIHAGWRSAVGGIVARTVQALAAGGARTSTCRAAIGPCIRQPNYEVDDVVRDAALRARPAAEALFLPQLEPGRWRFDLAGFVAAELAANGVKRVDDAGVDTLDQPLIYFSYRRGRSQGEAAYGVQLSGVVVPG